MHLQNTKILEISKKEKQVNGGNREAFLTTREHLARCPEPQKAPANSHQRPGQWSGPLQLDSVSNRLGPCLHQPHVSKARFLLQSLGLPPIPGPANPTGVRLYLCLFWSIEQFLSLFNIFQISGDCFPPLDVVWAPANGNTRRLPAAAGAERKLRAEMLVKFSFSWADLSPLIITQQSLISLNLAPCVDTCVPPERISWSEHPHRPLKSPVATAKGGIQGTQVLGASHWC